MRIVLGDDETGLDDATDVERVEQSLIDAVDVDREEIDLASKSCLLDQAVDVLGRGELVQDHDRRVVPEPLAGRRRAVLARLHHQTGPAEFVCQHGRVAPLPPDPISINMRRLTPATFP